MAAEDVLRTVLLRMDLKETSKALVMSYVDEIMHRILHYCNITEIPQQLEGVWASMVIDALRIEQSSRDEIADSADGGESVKIGDISIGPAQKSGLSNTSKAVIDAVVLDYRADLRHYRRMRMV